MKKALITGSQGFVGNYLRKELEDNGYTVTGLDIQTGENVIVADLLDANAIQSVIESVQPDVIFHLAGQANVAKSWSIPQKTIEINVIAAINLMDAVRKNKPDCRMVLVGSSDQYGNLGEAGKLVSEALVTNPQTPYAVSKKAQEEMAQVYVKSYGLNISMTRSFNHAGAGQGKGFLIPDFAFGIVAVERGEQLCLSVGNLTAKRDFTHVKDVVRAYRLIAEKGHAGEVYNVGSGITYSAQEILDKLCALSKCEISVKQDPAKMRPSDTPVICCDHSKLSEHTGWQPIETLDTMLEETLTYYRRLSEKVEE